MMPDLTGFDLMRSLQELHGASEKAPVVILTARDRPEDREIGDRLGAVGYLLKPATRGQLVDAIRLALDSSPSRDTSA
jgi:DNA-binding response OmpR family regulator